MISAIIFDLGRVLIEVDVQKFFDSLGLEFNLSIEELLDNTYLNPLNRELDAGRIDFSEYISQFNATYGTSFDYQTFKNAWNSMLVREVPGIRDILEELTGYYPLYVLSNISQPHHDYVRQHFSILDYFDQVFLSYQLGLLKPDPAIFQNVIHAIGMMPSELLYIDDLERNVKQAQELGLQGIVFESSGQLRKELKLRQVFIRDLVMVKVTRPVS